MKKAITQEEATLRYSKMIVAHLVTSVHGYEQFQEIAVELLAQLLIDIIKKLSEKVAQLLRLQKRNVPNSLHLLLVSENLKLFERENVYEHILASRRRTQCFEKSQLLSQYGAVLFSSLQKTNEYKSDPHHPNIAFIPPSCTFDFSKALPHRREIYQLFKVIQPKDNHCRLKAYSILRPAVIEIGEEEDEVVEVYQKDRIRRMYAARNKISKKFANSNTNETMRSNEPYLPLSRTAAINLDSMENLPKSIIDLDDQISNNFTRNYIVIDSPQ